MCLKYTGRAFFCIMCTDFVASNCWAKCILDKVIEYLIMKCLPGHAIRISIILNEISTFAFMFIHKHTYPGIVTVYKMSIQKFLAVFGCGDW